jgi:exonuclease III
MLMLRLVPTLILFVLVLFSSNSLAQKERILLDGRFEDWNGRANSYTDPEGDGRFGYDFTSLVIENDEEYLYFSFDTGIEINLQDYNDIALLIDTDNSYSTGYPIDDIGADLIYYFGDRGGIFFYGNDQKNIDHHDIGLITLPTVSSERFEIGISRSAEINGQALFSSPEIKVILLQDVNNGDKVPDQSGGIVFDFDEQAMEALPKYSILGDQNSDFRLLSYNVLQDRIFEAPNSFQRLLTAIDPDIIAFQEIYNYTSIQTQVLIQSWLGGTWYSAKQGNDIITVSRYPILESYFVAGNGAFLLDVDGEEVLLINAHLPCCDNDSGRQEEVDRIMAFIRDAKAGQSSLDLKENTPILIAGDMNFVGKNRQVKTFLEGDIQNEFSFGADFAPDWDGSSFKDVMAYATQSPWAITWYSAYSDYNPGRLDYIIYSDAVLQLNNAFNLFSNLLPQDTLNHYGILRDDSQNASDHFPVVADFTIDYTNSTSSGSMDAEGKIIVYPNPFESYLTLELPDQIQKTQLVISNSQGLKIFESKDPPQGHPFRIRTENWPPGSYILSVFSKDRWVSSSLLIKH